MKNYADDANKTLKKSVEGNDKNINYYSGDLVKNLIPDTVPPIEEGVNITDSNYQDDMYSDEQLARHKESNMNVYTVDGIPSRWYHNKLRSTWHFDSKANPQEKTFTVMCKLSI